MTTKNLGSVLMSIAGALFLVAAAIGGFDNLSYVALGVVFLGVGVSMRGRGTKPQ
jgi:hypothetical protein